MIEKVYDPKKVENRIYQFWLETEFFNPDKLPGKRKKKFVDCFSPSECYWKFAYGSCPLNFTIQDILIRWKRIARF